MFNSTRKSKFLNFQTNKQTVKIQRTHRIQNTYSFVENAILYENILVAANEKL